jgi:hypothetical protein
MFVIASHFARKGAYVSTACALLLVTACAPRYSAPVQVQASNPTVTYQYHGDRELFEANQNAMGFCSQYQSVARTANISTASNGVKTVVFECMAAPPAPPVFNPNSAYNYTSDQDLLDASRNAEIYCRANGSRRASSTISTTANGGKVVTFQCGL